MTASGSRPIATVFGGSGFVARYIVGRLADAGYQVRAASRNPSRSRHLLPMGTVGQIERIYAPLQEPDKIAQAVDGAEIVVNTVGLLAQFGQEQTFAKTMHHGAGAVAKASTNAGVDRLVHLSAIGASHEGPSDYAKAKAAGEDAVFAAFSDATILRPSVIFGVEDQFFNRFAAMPFLPLIGGGTSKFQPVYVGDVAKAAQTAWQSDQARGQIYELGGPQVLSFRDCMEVMCQVIGQTKPMVPLPWGIAQIIGAFGFIPGAPITADQVKALTVDNVVTDGAKGFEALGIQPQDMRAILPSYLEQYIEGGKLGTFHD